MRRIPENVKRRIVEHLACYTSRPEVAKLIAAEFDLSLTPRHIRAYDPTSFQFAASERWHRYFNDCRLRYSSELGDVAIAHHTYHFMQLQNLLDEAMAKGDLHQAMTVLEAASRMAPR